MNQHRLKIFMTIARTKSLSGTARLLHFTQPTVSAALNQLEKELDTRLVMRERGAHKVYLTPAGKAFVPLARQWLEADAQIEYYKQAQQKKVLRLAANSNGHEYIVGYVVQKLRQRLPELEIRLLEMSGFDRSPAIDNNLFDAAFYYGPCILCSHSGTPINAIELYQEERYVVCPADTCLPDRLLLPSDLDPQLEIRHSGIGKTAPFSKWRESAFPYHEEEKSISVENISAIPAYLTTSGSWALLPVSVARAKVASSEGRLTYRRLETPPPARSLCILISKVYPETRVIRELLECCSEYIDERPYLTRSEAFPPNRK